MITIIIYTLIYLHSENYIFGKFDTFCRRLERISYQLNTIQEYAGLADIRIEGIDGIIVKYKTIVESTKKKSYDILDHRKAEVNIVNLLLQVHKVNLCYNLKYKLEI